MAWQLERGRRWPVRGKWRVGPSLAEVQGAEQRDPDRPWRVALTTHTTHTTNTMHRRHLPATIQEFGMKTQRTPPSRGKTLGITLRKWGQKEDPCPPTKADPNGSSGNVPVSRSPGHLSPLQAFCSVRSRWYCCKLGESALHFRLTVCTGTIWNICLSLFWVSSLSWTDDDVPWAFKIYLQHIY